MRTVHALLLTLVIAIVAFVAFSYWSGAAYRGIPHGSPAVAVGTRGVVDPQAAREKAGELGDKAANAANRINAAVGEAELTAKIKAKMALDDRVKARKIDVTTNGSVVTLDGKVDSQAARDRAVALARETDGITRVIDHLVIERERH